MAGTPLVAAESGSSRVQVPLKISQLQNLCKRDPAGYREDYDAQVRTLESQLRLGAQMGSSATAAINGGSGNSNRGSNPQQQKIVELIQFAAAVSSSSYKGAESDRIAQLLMGVLVGAESAPVINTVDDGNKKNNKNSKKPDPLAAVASVTVPVTAALAWPKEVRQACVSALILMRNKGAVPPLQLWQLFFRLIAVLPDKSLRELLYHHMVNDLRNLNKKGKRDDVVNRNLQSFLHRVVSFHGRAETTVAAAGEEEGATDIAAKRATDMVCELYRRQVWTDARTVAILASAVESPNTTVSSRAMRFFLGIENKMALDSQREQDEDWETKNHIDFHLHSKKTKAHARQVTRQLKNRKRAQQRREQQSDWMENLDPHQDQGVEHSRKLYPALELLRDPQGLAETILARIRKQQKSTKYETKLLMLNFVTRLVGNHELLLLPLYPFLQKYLGGHQRDVTAILAYCVQACHEQVPPDQVFGILKTIAHNFITERCSEEQMAVGINAARAICARVPSALRTDDSDDKDEEMNHDASANVHLDVEAFARDLAAFARHRDRSVSIAGKAWTNFLREVHPGLLQGKDRGLLGTARYKSGAKPLRYGEREVAAGVEGADLLLAYEAARKRKQKANKNGEDDDENSDDGDGSGEWQDVEEDEESDEEAPTLVNLDDAENPAGDEDNELDLSKLSKEEREKLKQNASSTRIFSTAEFAKMRKLVDRENRLKRDPREAARRKRAIAQGRGEFSSDGSGSEFSDDDSDEDAVHIAGAVNPEDIMAEATKRKSSKAERLEKILAGRSKFESKQRDGGATNEEKKRRKNFLMSKSSYSARSKKRGKGGLQKQQREKQTGQLAKKRRRRM